ncbi:hypothetical protein ATI61_12068 [Archangium gephyra]|uniref:Uncharacterized protein n=1 Tax=Archangium gephyra TaxID=48 RepID=A0AAC8Q5E3_9BACT|nr:hypothetical protein [Archangium gephyra]AKJ00668.1 Hypothetical protein AA314_02294 [Archangium gephyra]REG20712.1 hypothetical protein ATI61_12068 [Archangium gephyra]
MSAPTPPALESLRRQLEGRWEHLERARERYTRLIQQLSSFRWQSALRGQPELLKETREHEAELTEVLAYVEHRARREQWPREHPGLRVLQELRTQRVKLEALAHKRLAQAPLQNGASLAEALSGLETLTLALPPRPPGADDPVLFEDWMLSWTSPGRVWLTPNRLLWRPWFGDPVQLPLAALQPEAVILLPGWIGLHVKRMGLTLFSLSYSKTLTSLLRLCLRTVNMTHGQPQANAVATSPAYCRHVNHPSPERWGLGVFGPHGATLLPTRHRTFLDVCLKLLGVPVLKLLPAELRPLESLVEHLRQLPPGEFEHALRELTRARDGRFWPLTGLHRGRSTGRELVFQSGKQYLVVPQPPPTLHDVLQQPRPAGDSHSPESHPLVHSHPPGNSWFQDNRFRLGIAGGAALFYSSALFAGPFPGHPLSYVGYALLAWTSMSYTKNRGITVMPGLLFSFLFYPLLTCFPLILVFMWDILKPKQP